LGRDAVARGRPWPAACARLVAAARSRRRPPRRPARRQLGYSLRPMKVNIDTDTRQLTVERDGAPQSLALYSPEAFSVLSELWVKVGWELKYSYAFSWMGRPVIQLPEDMIRIQEVIYRVRPDVIIETGVAHGG